MKSKKKYLLLYNEMQIGGIEKSIVSLLNVIDYSEVDVDLFLMRKKGEFINYIPKEVNIIESGFQGDFSESARVYLKSNVNFAWKVRRLYYIIIQKLQKFHILSSGTNISYIASIMPRMDKQYDVAIAYVDWTFDYLVHYVKAEKKYAYIHVNYDDSIHEPRKDRRLFEKCDGIYAVSKDSCSVLKKRFPTCADKMEIWNNIVDERLHLEMAKHGEGFSDSFTGIRILTVGRIAFEKGIDIAIEACAILRDKGYNFRWYHVGQGELYQSLCEKVRELKLEKWFIFLGASANPYSLFRESDMYVQCSRYEGYGLTLAEAAIFNKPRVVTNIDVFREQVEHMKNGILVELEAQAFADAVALLMDNKELYDEMVKNLGENRISNQNSIKIFYQL